MKSAPQIHQIAEAPKAAALREQLRRHSPMLAFGRESQQPAILPKIDSHLSQKRLDGRK